MNGSMSGKHTPTPWKIEGSIYEHMAAGIASAVSGEERGIAQVWKHAKAMDDARLIVAAVNSYADNQAEIEMLRTLVGECVKQLDMIIERGEPTDFIQWRAEIAGALEPKPGRKVIARAIMAERERCALIAEARKPLYELQGQNACAEIASSIRNLPVETKE